MEHFGSNSIAHLRRVVEVVESLEAQIAELNKKKSHVYKEAKKTGLEVKPIKAVVQARRQDPKKRAAHSVMFETYFEAVADQPEREQSDPLYPRNDTDETTTPDQETDQHAEQEDQPPHTGHFSDDEIPEGFEDSYD